MCRYYYSFCCCCVVMNKWGIIIIILLKVNENYRGLMSNFTSIIVQWAFLSHFFSFSPCFFRSFSVHFFFKPSVITVFFSSSCSSSSSPSSSPRLLLLLASHRTAAEATVNGRTASSSDLHLFRQSELDSGVNLKLVAWAI